MNQDDSNKNSIIFKNYSKIEVLKQVVNDFIKNKHFIDKNENFILIYNRVRNLVFVLKRKNIEDSLIINI